jgi:hypothetical protein
MSSLLNRLNGKFTISDDCWNWTAGKDKNGYGQIKINRKQFRAHRVMYEAVKGSIPKGLVVMHSCDNPSCVNPDHLQIGTNKDNSQDMIKKGRKHLIFGGENQRGEKNGRALITEDDVREIRKRHANGERQVDIAIDYGLTQIGVSKITTRRTWKHVF